MNGNSERGTAGDGFTGAVPFQEVLAGSLRPKRRRAWTGAAAFGSAAALVGGGIALDHLPSAAAAPANLTAAAAPAAPAAPVASTGALSAAPVASSPAAADPFTPVRTLVGQGEADGHRWQAWAALWPCAPDAEQAVHQARLLWQEQRAAGSDAAEPTEDFVRRYRQVGQDTVDLYLVVDGVRVAQDATFTTPVTAAPGWHAATLSGALVGHRGKDGTPPPVDVVMAQVGPEVTRVAVDWSDGTTTEPAPAALGTSPVRWIALARPAAGVRALSWKLYGAGGEPIAADAAAWLKN
ncbi:hypothetical protein [Kitasatospora sp. NPDC097643]|uniref:hypothetical protein n=1 Tax=Kitasatospora sp. NPDC097643 TaxID=3157230 RepID=UPI00331AA334